MFGRSSIQKLDFDDEARKIFEKLNLPDGAARAGDSYHDVDCIYQHPVSGGRVFIGNLSAAQKRDTLANNNITCIINCQDANSVNFFEKDPAFEYYRFPIAWWWRSKDMDTDRGVMDFFDGVMTWIDSHVADGKGVMMHCLAGAHRAGSTGIAYMMHATGADLEHALVVTKRCRPIVEPIGQLGELLKRFDRARRALPPVSAPAGGYSGLQEEDTGGRARGDSQFLNAVEDTGGFPAPVSVARLPPYPQRPYAQQHAPRVPVYAGAEDADDTEDTTD